MIREHLRSLLIEYRSRLQYRTHEQCECEEEVIRVFLRMPEDMP
jgi:hypothetical protein